MDSLIPVLAATITALAWLFIIRRYDRLEPEPMKALLYAGFLGGLAAIVPAALLNTLVSLFLNVKIGVMDENAAGIWIFYSFVGFNEEIWKALAAALLMRNNREFNEPIDGMIYALTISLGFAAFENVDYILTHGLGILISRSLLSVPAHLAFGAIWGYGLTKAKFLVPGHKYAATMAPFVICSGLAHAAFDILLVTLGSKSLIMVILLVGIILIHTRFRLKYLVGQSPFKKPEKCFACQTVNPKGSDFCQQCGADLRLDFYQVCMTCGTRYAKSGVYCPHCGKRAA